MAGNVYALMEAGQIWLWNYRYPGYLVGAHGAVISLIKSPKILSPIKMGAYDGYQLKSSSGNIVKVYRHRLVAETFIGSPGVSEQCRHLDGDKTNCDISNLRWGTKLENEADKLRHGTRVSGERHYASKLTKKDVSDMKSLRSNGFRFWEIAKKFGVTTMTAHRAITGKSWVSE